MALRHRVRKSGEIQPPRYTLAPKGFEVLDASPFPTREADQPPAAKLKEPTLGEQMMGLAKDLTSGAKEGVKEEAKEGMKKLVHVAIGGGLAYAYGAARAGGIL